MAVSNLESPLKYLPMIRSYGRLQPSGFTLVELMMVTAMVAILAAVIMPSLRKLITTIRANAAIREVASDLQWAKLRAVADNNDYWVTFNTSNNSYSIYDDGDNDGPESGELIKTIVIPDRNIGIEYGYVNGAKNTSGNNITDDVTFDSDRVRFYSRGTANSNGGLYLIPTEDLSTGDRDHMRYVSVIQNGKVRVYRYDAGKNPPWR